MNKDVAEKIHILAMQMNAQLDDSVALVRDTCSEEEFAAYRRRVGTVMGTVIEELMNPICREHPDLLPEEMGGSYVVDKAIFRPRFYPKR